jgi:hypothetical protein
MGKQTSRRCYKCVTAEEEGARLSKKAVHIASDSPQSKEEANAIDASLHCKEGPIRTSPMPLDEENRQVTFIEGQCQGEDNQQLN